MITTIRKFGRLLNAGQKKRVAILLAMMIIGAALEVCGVSMMLPLMTTFMQQDILETNQIAAWVAGLFGLQDHRQFVLFCIITLIVVFIVKNLFLMLQYYAQSRFIANNNFQTQRRLLDTLIHRPYEYYITASSGEVLRIVLEDTGRSFGLLSNVLFFATESIVSVALIITVFVIDPVMTIVVIVMLAICLLVITRVVRPVMRREGLVRQKHSTLATKWIIQSVNGIKEIKVTHREAFFQRNFEHSGAELAKNTRMVQVYEYVPKSVIEMVTICSVLVAIGVMVGQGRPMQSLIPALSAFAMAAIKLLPSANRIVNTFNSIYYNTPALDKMLENIRDIEETKQIYAKLPEHVEGGAGISLEKEIVLSDISYSYPNSESDVLEHASMNIPIGRSVGVVGTSGAGKTTAVDIMLGLLAPREGSVLADGVDVMTDYAGWLSHIGYIPQTIFMLDDSIRANVAFGVDPKSVSDEKIWHALSEAQLEDFVKSLPEGLDTAIGERGIRLSGGQRQRIGIARALYTDPEVLVFDEATSSLDNDTEAAIMESINSLHGKKTLVIIAHRLQTIEKCDIVYRVRDGKIERER